MEFKHSSFTVQEVFPKNMGDDYIDWGVKTVGAPIVWEKTKGKGVKVAVLDTGVDLDHPDLIQNLREFADFTGSRHGVEDVGGHGTHCAGVIGGSDNQIGIIGIAPEADLYIAKVLGDNGSGSFESIMKGIKWAMAHDVDVISMSLGASAAYKPPQAFHDLVKQAVAQGIILVAATGNENSAVCYPAAYDEVIAVSAINKNMTRADFSNFGIQNHIAAPGVDIVSTYKQGTYARLSGTSMATPMVAAGVALYVARFKDVFHGTKPTTDMVYRALENCVTDLGVEGKDDHYGLGMLNLTKLL